jgi:CRISPR-associated protein Cas2
MKWLACYDIADDSRRERLVKVLLDYGQRVQESVFWLDADEDLIERMHQRAQHAIVTAEDSLWLVPICEACAKKIEACGASRVPRLPEFYVV